MLYETHCSRPSGADGGRTGELTNEQVGFLAEIVVVLVVVVVVVLVVVVLVVVVVIVVL